MLILAIEPRLIAQATLEFQDGAGALAISRQVLVRMLDDLDGITDEHFDALFTA